MRFFYDTITNAKGKEMNNNDFLPDPSLTMEEKKTCCDIMRSIGYIPQPASENEIGAVMNWLNNTKQSWPNLMTYEYKDCCFQKEGGKWNIALRTNDFLFQEMLAKGGK